MWGRRSVSKMNLWATLKHFKIITTKPGAKPDEHSK
jgi:hypothetical protein